MTSSRTRDAGVVRLNHHERQAYDQALLKARTAAHTPAEFVGQESFMQATEVLDLARHARIGAETTVLDLCCGVGGPGTLVARQLGCTYLGVDASAAAVNLARSRVQGETDCQFVVARIPPLPDGNFDVVMLLETMLAFPNKASLIRHVARALPAGGRFVFTIEEGQPLTDTERRLMPESRTVWLVPLADVLASLDSAGLRVIWQADCSRAHQTVAERLFEEFIADARNIAENLGPDALDSLLRAHLLWSDWLRQGRARKFAFVVEKTSLDQHASYDGEFMVGT